MSLERKAIIQLLKEGGIGVLATDTIYGIVGSARNPQAVERIYKLRHRDIGKPMIVLINALDNLNSFNIKLTQDDKVVLSRLWPGKVSVIFSCPDNQFEYLHRGAKTLAFRLPAKEELIEILKQVGPLVAPSANPEGREPARTTHEAEKYFGDKVDFYFDESRVEDLPSTLVTLEDGKVMVKRQGAVKISI